MSYTPRKRSSPESLTKPQADFSWPPPDEELAQCFATLQSETALDGTGVKTAEPSVAPDLLAPHTTSVDAAETPAQPDPKHSGIEDSLTSGIAVAQRETALDGTRAGEMAAEIAHLLTLIEGLTQKIEWRITNVTGR
jgi:hypothetical protein